jgi:hypothetical protein
VTVTIAGHARRSLLPTNLSVCLGNHFARDPVILYVRITIRKALTLRSNLIGRHFNFASAFNELFKFFCHRVLSRFTKRRYLRTPLYRNKFLNGPFRKGLPEENTTKATPQYLAFPASAGTGSRPTHVGEAGDVDKICGTVA